MMRLCAALAILASTAVADGPRGKTIQNAHVVYDVGGARAELWTRDTHAHLKREALEIFWDLAGERRLVLKSGRTLDEPIAFAHELQPEELFPRGVKLRRAGRKKLLGRACVQLRFQQPTVDGKARSTWCVWKGVPLQLVYEETSCRRRGHCKKHVTRWKARSLELGRVGDADLTRR